MTFTMIVTSVLRSNPFIHTLIWVSWASNDAHQNVHQGHSIVAPIGKQRASGLVIIINIKPQCHVVWEHVDTTPRSTRSQISSNSSGNLGVSYLSLDVTVWLFQLQVNDPISESMAAHTTQEEKRSQSD